MVARNHLNRCMAGWNLMSRGRDKAINPDFWPVSTLTIDSDILVSEVSLVQLIGVCGTPCVHSDSSSMIGNQDQPSDSERTAVLAVSVVGIARTEHGQVFVQTDARLDNLRLTWSEARLLARVSAARDDVVLIHRSLRRAPEWSTADVVGAMLPRDLRVGDVVVVPSRPIATDWTLHPHPLTGTDNAFPESTHTRRRSVGATD
jgi:hypothetical protein